MSTSLLLLRSFARAHHHHGPGRLLQFGTIFRRSLLSSAYACEDAWLAQRQQCESLKHISPSRYFFELNNKYQQRKAVSAVDVDIYLNSLHRAENIDELEHIVRRLRASRETVNTLDSTGHAVCRFYLRHGKRDALLKVLNSRVEFGIFPDHFIANILLDGAVKEGDFEAAFEVVKLMMLQEDAGNEVTRTLALHTLLHLFNNDAVLTSEKEKGEDQHEDPPAEEEEVDDEDIEYIRVPYLTNAYFDDHFDLTKRAHLFGKSLYFFGLHVAGSANAAEEDRILGATAQIIGLLGTSWSDCCSPRDVFKGQTISEEAVQVALKLQAQEESQETTDEKKKAIISSVVSRVQSLPKSTSERSLSSLMAVRLAALPSLEAADIAAQQALFARFESTRLSAITAQLNRLLAEQRRSEIEQKRGELEAKRRLYYFFENFPQHEIDFVEAERRIAELQANTVVDEDYVPPEV
ncbi:Mitochondrial 28S ribosomal protein S27 [Tyrophagus putrescentiae]|nr:Mitochondrial 28S ribosomal protein S27 [Tyrophagus putrescentiae]